MENPYENNQTEQPEFNDMFDREPVKEKKPKKERKLAKKCVSALAVGLVFGLGASVTFQGANAIGNKYFGTEKKETQVVQNVKPVVNSSTVTSDVSDIVEKVMPSVVSITNMSVSEVQSFFGGTQLQESESAGSGIIVGQNDNELLIVTNNHVVEGSDTLTVSFIDEQSVGANIKGTQPTKDLAVVAVPLSDIPEETSEKIAVATLGNSDELKVGEPAIAIGNALGYGQSVTSGIVSAKDRDIKMEGFDSTLIQTNAAINPGNSGGPLLNANGEVIGINTVKLNQEAVEGMGYAIPISDAGEEITNLMNRETRVKIDEKDRGYLGIQGVDVTSDSSKMYNMPIGVYVSKLIEGGGAEKAGITKGSIITKFGGASIEGMQSLQEQLQYYKKGETVEVTLMIPQKNGEYAEETASVELGKRPD